MPEKISHSKRLELHYKLNDADGLMQALYQLNDLRYLMQYDKYLNQHFDSELLELYVGLVEEYLGNHIGNYAHTFIQELKAHLAKNNMYKISKRIDRLIEEKFSHRTNLNDFS